MKLCLGIYILIFTSYLICGNKVTENPEGPYILITGIAQDAGYPQINCHKNCCKDQWKNNKSPIYISSLALINKESYYFFDATPDLKYQIALVQQQPTIDHEKLPSGIFLTHAHIGHYTGLQDLGREALSADNIHVYAMPRMYSFLETNGPWSQLVSLQNINLHLIHADQDIKLASDIRVIPVIVPHRDEYSETVGFYIVSNHKKALFIPDIDKWNQWSLDIVEEIKNVDYALIDATFYQNGEISGRDMSEIPHPFVQETMNVLEDLPRKEKNKVYFIHMNHTNPLLDPASRESKLVQSKGFRIARQGMRLFLND